jgi:hypothetical protein
MVYDIVDIKDVKWFFSLCEADHQLHPRVRSVRMRSSHRSRCFFSFAAFILASLIRSRVYKKIR